MNQFSVQCIDACTKHCKQGDLLLYVLIKLVLEYTFISIQLPSSSLFVFSFVLLIQFKIFL